jgi:lysophospholipid acyltransferase (LPLAT)-like uncharacterized protein
VAAAAALGRFVVWTLASTWRMRTERREVLDAFRAAGKPVVLAIWHGELLPGLWRHRGEPISILVSTHADGEIIARIIESLGFTTVRGSSSRGGARALLELVGVLRGGRDVAVTPDGPRGPRRVFAPGAVVAAMRAGAPVVAVGAQADRAWRLGSWDRLVIPKPFARVTVRYSEALYATSTTPREAEAEAPRFATLIGGVCAPDGP